MRAITFHLLMNETCPKYSGVTAKAGEARSCQVTVNEMGIQIILVATAKMPVSQKKCLTLLSGGSYGSFCRSRLWWWMFQIEKGTQRLEPVSLVKLWKYSREFECNGRGRSAFGRCPKMNATVGKTGQAVLGVYSKLNATAKIV